jgi:hypothetical protein
MWFVRKFSYPVEINFCFRTDKEIPSDRREIASKTHHFFLIMKKTNQVNVV